MGIYTLNQKIYLGSLPAGLQFHITDAVIFVATGGYDISFRAPNGNMINDDGKCVSGGVPFQPIDPKNANGKTCKKTLNFSAQGGFQQPVYVGEMKFSSKKLVSFETKEAGSITLHFQILSGGKSIASGTINANPSKFGAIGRPDFLPIELRWDGGTSEQIVGSIRPNIGVDPGPVHMMFLLGEDQMSIGMNFTRHTKFLDKVAGFGVEALIELNKFLITRKVPGSGKFLGMVLKVVKTGLKIPGKIDKANKAKEKFESIAQFLQTVTKRGIEPAPAPYGGYGRYMRSYQEQYSRPQVGY
ncbi:hypothetical protein TWF694_001234 [Orbilia ellipsospora]|uniref:Uncharacterized protein n=1 Tax=Orbilia ellipsospora TaxID=2528407 RepID=A0AAV9XTL6_9PEZI